MNLGINIFGAKGVKRALVLGLCALGCAGASAQDFRADSCDMGYDDVARYVQFKKAKELSEVKKDAFSTNSQIRVGTGFMLPMVTLTTPDVYELADGCYGEQKCSFAFGVEYSYRVWDFLEVVGSVHYWGGTVYEECCDVERDDALFRESYREYSNDTQLSFGVYARYNWFNSKWVSIYSSLGCWLLTTGATCEDLSSGERETQWFTGCYVVPELTPFGIRVGRKLFGYFEPFSLSARGNLMNVGLGVRF